MALGWGVQYSRGDGRAEFKDYILPLIFVKCISDVFEDELKRLSDEFGDEKVAYDLAQKDHKLIRFFIPQSSTWPEIRKKTVI